MFFETEHLIVFAPIADFFFGDGGAVLVGVPEFDDVEAAAVDIEVDVALLVIGGDAFPDFDFGVHSLYCFPGCQADAFAVDFGRDEHQYQFAKGFR